MLDFNFRYLGNIETQSILDKLKTLSDSDWDIYSYRQDRNNVHKKTKTIPFIYDESYEVFKGKKSSFYNLFEDDILQINKFLTNAYNHSGDIIRIIAVNLPKGEHIDSHYDQIKETFKIHSRIHIPIQTHKDVIFTVEGESINMKVGEVIEINNNGKLHGVENNSPIDRLHLIVDWQETKQSTII